MTFSNLSFTTAVVLVLIKWILSTSRAESGFGSEQNSSGLAFGNSDYLRHNGSEEWTEGCDFYQFEDLLYQLRNNTMITLCGNNSTFSLNRVFNFSKLHNITITSSLSDGSTAVVECIGNAGLNFTECDNVTISNIAFKGCGLKYPFNINTENGATKIIIQGSIFMINCTNTHFLNVHVSNSNGTGLILVNVLGKVNILNCTFKANALNIPHFRHGDNDLYYAGGGGIYIEITSLSESETVNSEYTIRDCVFQNNNAYVTALEVQSALVRGLWNGMGRGGGLNIAIKGVTQHNYINISEAHFLSNSAISGGGINLFFQDSTSNNNIEIKKSVFEKNNSTKKRGGGGVYVGYTFFSNAHLFNNSIVFSHCQFLSNEARFGGGTALYSSRSDSDIMNNSFEFINCTWEYNKAKYGSAVTVLPQDSDILKSGFTPVPQFKDCTFESNYVIDPVRLIRAHYMYSSRGKGAFLASSFSVMFEGYTLFKNNNGSAVYLTSSIIKFAENSKAIFSNNEGLKGGAVAMFGFSAIYARDRSSVTFVNNVAISRGGAIYFLSFNKQAYMHSKSCFIQYEGSQKNVAERSLMFNFSMNKAMISNEIPLSDRTAKTHFGDSIFATTLIPCQNNCSHYQTESVVSPCTEGVDTRDPFSCIGTFIFEGETNLTGIATSAKQFCPLAKSSNQTLKFIPGKEAQVPIIIKDDLDQQVWEVHRTSIRNKSHLSNVEVAPTHMYNNDNTLKLYGDPGDRAQVMIATTGTREVAVSFEVEILPCPPGFVLNVTTHTRECVCSVSVDNKTFRGIRRCDEIAFQAYLIRGYWIGYVKTKENLEQRLLSGYCPNGYCLHYQIVGHVKDEYLLPNSTSMKGLDEFMCGPNRTGILCGSCSKNFSAFYHSNGYHCELSENCQWGMLLYIVTELFPVTVLFTIVIIFNISFTSGALNGVLFFFQVIDTMEISAKNFIFIAHPLHRLTQVYRFIYRMFNLNFFTITGMSFCLWEGARPLDVIAFKYVTICYSLLLVVLTVTLIRMCNYSLKYKRLRFLQKCTHKPFKLRSFITHGLTAFIVMCYSQCTRVSFLILTYGNLYSNAPARNVVRRAVFYDGEMDFFGNEHIKYVIPAAFFIVFVVFIPPLLLVIYPLCHKVFALVKLQETHCLRLTCKVLPLDKLKPLFDSFQGAFKDNFRFFSGLYFLYRLIALADAIFSDSLTRFYTILEIFLILMLTFHAVAQPYKRRWHNILDTLLFCNLAIINGLTLYNYKRSADSHDYSSEINTAASIQIILIFLPFGYFVVYTVSQLILKVKRYCQNKRKSSTVNEEDNDYHWMVMVDSREDMVEPFITSITQKDPIPINAYT